MNATCDSTLRLSLGAYVLGALDPVERAQVDAHLSGCASCRDELTELAAMPGLLARVRLDDVLEPAPSPSPAMIERLLRRLRAARRARRRRYAVAGVAVALAAAGVGTVVLSTSGGGSASESASVAAVNARTGVSAKLGLRPASWGTAVHVRLRGVPAGTRCRLIAVSKSGAREVAGTWRATYEGTADLQAATAIPKDQLASFAVVNESGHPLVRAAVGD
jgi:putative zinc finger protein